MADIVRLTVPGKPEPRGSKIAVPVYDEVRDRQGNVLLDQFRRPLKTPRLDRKGRPVTYLRDDNAKSGPWMKKIQKAARAQHGRLLLEGPLRLALRFYLPRPQYHFGTGRNAGVVKERYAAARPTIRPDRLKLARAVEDALTDVLYVDDGQTVCGPVEKYYADPGEEPRVEIEIMRLAAEARQPRLRLQQDNASNLHERMTRWLDDEEGRTLTLVSANADFGGPAHVIEYAAMDHEPKSVYGESREEIMGKIEELTSEERA